MRPVRPQEQVDEIKHNILDTALQIITREGYHALTMRWLGRSLGMTAPNLYNYFKSKDEIYITLMIQGFTSLRAALLDAAEKNESPLVKARAILQAYLQFGLTQPEHYELMFSSHAPKSREYQGTDVEPLSEQEHALSMEVAASAETYLQDALESVGLIATAEQRKTMLIELWSLLHGMVSLHLTGNTGYLTECALETYEHILDLLLDRFIRQYGKQEN
jgi:AcrR family transcriptional regulator